MQPDEFFAVYDEIPNQRSAAFADLEMTAKGDDLEFDGWAAVFGVQADLGPHTEELRHGVFRKFLATGQNVPFLHEHDPKALLATTKSGRLRLLEEPRGLRTLALMRRTDLSERVKTLVDSGDITGMSFGFICGQGNSDWTRRNEKPHRVIKNIKRLLDVTTTWDPAYASAEAQFRTMAFAYPETAVALSGREHLLGVYPTQPDDDAADKDGEEEARSSETEDSGVSAPLLAARKRRLSLLTITLEGGELPDA